MKAARRHDARRFCRRLLGALVLAPAAVSGQPAPASPDAAIIHAARLFVSSGRVDLYVHGTEAPPALAAAADRALAAMQAMLQRPWDGATFGERVRLYVSGDVRISHVLGGYEHQNRPQAVVFLNPRVARLAVTGADATYAHELAHLLAWRYGSHSLREGLADYLALELHPGASIGPSPPGPVDVSHLAPGVRELLGSRAKPPAALIADPAFRRSYYAASREFVRYLVEVGGLPRFMQLYEAGDPEPAYLRLYGKSRLQLVVSALP